MSYHEQDDDPFDYPMADVFISETRPHPYRVGFRPRSWRDARSMEEAMKLNDREFSKWHAKCDERARASRRDSVSDLSSLRDEVSRLRRQVDELSKSVQQRANTTSRGLNVAPRA
jgi:hypothetical protein